MIHERSMLTLGDVKFFENFSGVIVESIPGLVISNLPSTNLFSGKEKKYSVSKNLIFYFITDDNTSHLFYFDIIIYYRTY